MKILLFRESEIKNINPDIIDTRGFGATDITLVYLAKYLAKKHEVKLYCPTEERRYYDNVEYIPYQDYGQFLVEKNRFKPDFIIITGNPSIIVRNFITGENVLFWQKNHPFEMKHFPINTLLEKNKIRRIIFSSDIAAEYGQNFYKNKEKIIGIYNGIRDIFFDDHRQKKNNKKILYVGSFNKNKGLYEFLNAASKLPDYTFEACGSFDMYGIVDNQYKNKCEKFFNYKNIIYNGISYGSNELAKKMQEAELIICNPMIGNKETCCVSALESMASQTPVLAGGCSLLDRIITQGGGLTFKNKLEDAISSLMKDEFRKTTLILKGKKWVENFRWDEIIKKWNSLFEELKNN